MYLIFITINFCNGGLSEKDALDLAVSTWPKSIRPVVHYSESKSIHENNPLIKPQAHSDYIKNIPKTYNNDVDIMVEAKKRISHYTVFKLG